MHDFNQNNNCIQRYLCCCPGSQGKPGASGILSPVYANLISTTAQTVTSSSQYGTAPLALRLTGFSSANDFSLSSDGKTLTLNQAGVYIFSYGVILSSGASAAKNTCMTLTLNRFGVLDSFSLVSNLENASKTVSAVLSSESKVQLTLSAQNTHTFSLPELYNGNAFLTVFRIGTYTPE